MTAHIGIPIQQREAGTVAGNDIISFVIIGLSDAGEQTRLKLRLGGQDVFYPPRGMQRFHAEKLKLVMNKESRKSGMFFARHGFLNYRRRNKYFANEIKPENLQAGSTYFSMT